MTNSSGYYAFTTEMPLVLPVKQTKVLLTEHTFKPGFENKEQGATVHQLTVSTNMSMMSFTQH
jgi:hypothetical protein